MSETFTVTADGTRLHGERWPGPGPVLVLLHEGVADLRGWRQTAELLAASADVYAYDRRGFGQTPPSKESFSHVQDLLAVIGHTGAEQVWLVGASAGGGLALDTVLAAPDRVAGLVLIAPAVSGAPEPVHSPDLEAIGEQIEAALEAGDEATVNRLETRIWLDGPGQPEGRVSGPARELALDMNAIIIRNEGQDYDEGVDEGTDAWHHLAWITVPVTVACGDYDLPWMTGQSSGLASRLPSARYVVLPGVAHQPYLEQPGMVADMISAAISGS
jgi:pimeloyl-ACP methyl ester carboxylesterase